MTMQQSDNLFVLSPKQSTPLASHQQSVETNQVAFCWSGHKVFVTTVVGTVRILSYPDFSPVAHHSYGERAEFTLNGHTSSCVSAELSPTGRYLATGGTDSIVALWDTTDWICQRTISNMAGPVRSISRPRPSPHMAFTFHGETNSSDKQASHSMVALWLEGVTRVSWGLLPSRVPKCGVLT